MKLKKITLNNIRSHKYQEINFPEGSTLLSGNVGSGKTSILLAIEFGLFGLQPGQRGSSLLRNGEISGGIVIEFELDGKEIKVERNLKKGKTISQDYCAITINGEKKETSVTELKNTILNLLNYPKEFSKKQNLLYKFTVYTPQEEMKQIILQDSETRINTLRHIFGIDKYKKIIENTSIMISKIREEKKLREGIISNLEQDKINILSKENELESKHYNLSSIEKDLFIKTEERKKVQEEKDKVQGKIEEKNKIKQEMEKNKINISNKNDSISNNFKIIQNIQIQIKELEEKTISEAEIINLQIQINIKKEELLNLSEKISEILGYINSLNTRNRENASIKEEIEHIETCPTCLQKVDITYKENILEKLNSETSENLSKINNLNLEKEQISKRNLELRKEISSLEIKLEELKTLKIRQQGIAEKKDQIEEIEKFNLNFEKEISELDENLNSLELSFSTLREFDTLSNEVQEKLDIALREEKNTEIKVAELKREIEIFSKQIEELSERILRVEETKKQLDYLIEVESWVSQKFIPLVSFIEKNVMTKLKLEFSNLFSKWFSMLVSDSFDVKVNDDFSPVIQQKDYEIDYSYLSGGERTAIALAYRLSLNQVINSLLSKIKTRDLVILDEPTEGFSALQLDKMRDVLQQLNTEQLIIVSHEPKIESFVENIIKIRKDNGVSRIED